MIESHSRLSLIRLGCEAHLHVCQHEPANYCLTGLEYMHRKMLPPRYPRASELVVHRGSSG